MYGIETTQLYDDDILGPFMLSFLLRHLGLIFRHNNFRPLTARVATSCLPAYPTLIYPVWSSDK